MVFYYLFLHCCYTNETAVISFYCSVFGIVKFAEVALKDSGNLVLFYHHKPSSIIPSFLLKWLMLPSRNLIALFVLILFRCEELCKNS